MTLEINKEKKIIALPISKMRYPQKHLLERRHRYNRSQLMQKNFSISYTFSLAGIIYHIQ